jgi:hypothetical protein
MLKDDINIPLVVTSGIVSCLLLLVALFGTHAFYLWKVGTITNEKWRGITYQEVYDLKLSQRTDIESPPRWVDSGKGVARIPISQAMQQFAADQALIRK